MHSASQSMGQVPFLLQTVYNLRFDKDRGEWKMAMAKTCGQVSIDHNQTRSPLPNASWKKCNLRCDLKEESESKLCTFEGEISKQRRKVIIS